MNPLVSIIVPAYNHAKYIQETINSLVGSTYLNCELIIVDDGSTDGTRGLIEENFNICHERFKKFKFISKRNEGISKTLNFGLLHASGDFVLPLASDDLIEPDAIELMIGEFLNDPQLGLACGDAFFIDSRGTALKRVNNEVEYSSFIQFNSKGKYNFRFPQDFGTYQSILSGNYIPIGALISKKALLAVGGFEESSPLEDWCLWLKLSKSYRFKYINKYLARYRIHSQNTISKNADILNYESLKLLCSEYKYSFENGWSEHWRSLFYPMLNGFRDNLDDFDSEQIIKCLLTDTIHMSQEIFSLRLLNQCLNKETNFKDSQIYKISLENSKLKADLNFHQLILGSISYRITKPLRLLKQLISS